jgi:hypothetical protein
MVELSDRDRHVLELKLQKALPKEVDHFVPFKAQPLPSTHRVPFQPVFDNSDKLTQPQPFQLHSDSRASSRHEFDEHLTERERQAAAEKAAAEAEQKKQAELELKQLRKQMEFKARPIMKAVSTPFEVRSSAKALTEPQSPPLATKLRGAVRASVQDENAGAANM